MDSVAAAQPFGRYVLTSRIAVGGMAEIFKARHEGPAGFSRELVIKRILPELARNQEFLDMFLDEARLVAQLSHPNVVQIHDFGEVDGAYFMAMELVHGPSLGGILKAVEAGGGRIPLPIAAKICAGVAEGLHYAHHLTGSGAEPLDIVHRDISTSNILVTYEGVPKVLDFGIAKAATQSHKTATGLIKGKLGYMPPEQVRSETLDGRADLYSLGVVLYRLVCQRMPYTGKSEFELMNAICSGTFPPAWEVRPDVPTGLDEIITRALALSPSARFQTGKEFCAALDQFCALHGGPVSSFDVAEFLKGLAAGVDEPLDALGLPGSSKLSVPPEALAELPAVPAAGVDRPAAPGATAPTEVLTSGTAISPTAPTKRTRLVSIAAAAAVVVAGLATGVLLLRPPAEPVEQTGQPGAGAQRAHPAEGAQPPAPAHEARADPPPGVAPGSRAAQPLAARPPPAEPEAQAPTRAGPDAGKRKPPRRRGRKAKRGRPVRQDPPPARATAPDEAIPGRVTVLVKPWGNVFVNGKKRGATPMAPLELSPGRYAIRVVQPDTGRSVERRVIVEPGKAQTQRFDLTQ